MSNTKAIYIDSRQQLIMSARGMRFRSYRYTDERAAWLWRLAPYFYHCANSTSSAQYWHEYNFFLAPKESSNA